MRKLLVRLVRQSPAMIVAMLALFVALTGTAVATTSALIGSAQIRNNSITGVDVKNRSLRPIDFRGSVRGPRGLRGLTGTTGATGAAGAAGAAGAKGDKGDTGEAGSALAFAFVDGAGTVNAGLSKNIAQANVIQTFTGGYCFGGLTFTPRNVVVSPESPGGNFDPEVGIGAGPSSCPAATQVRVFIRNSAGTLTNKNFFMLLN